MPFEKDPNDLGALWLKSGPKGEYMTGTINGQPVVVFRNTKKVAGSKQPDFRVLRPTPIPEAEKREVEDVVDDIGF